MANTDSEPFVRAQDKVVMSELLFFMWNKMHTHDANHIVRICDAFYDEKSILEEKTKFSLAIKKKLSSRRPPDKKTKDLDDILIEMKTRDDAGSPLPTFVASKIHNLPETDDGGVTNSQLYASFREMKRELVTKEALISSLDAVKNLIFDGIRNITMTGATAVPGAYILDSPSRRHLLPSERQPPTAHSAAISKTRLE